MPTGTIARLLIDKGFGFIRDEGGIEHFFHRSAVRGAVFELLREGVTALVPLFERQGRQPPVEEGREEVEIVLAVEGTGVVPVARAGRTACSRIDRQVLVAGEVVEVDVADLVEIPRAGGEADGGDDHFVPPRGLGDAVDQLDQPRAGHRHVVDHDPAPAAGERGSGQVFHRRVGQPAANIRRNIIQVRIDWYAVFEFRDGSWYCTFFVQCCD